MSILNIVESSKIVAIVRLDDLSDAIPLTEAMLAGGIRVVEFTLTNPDAIETITAIRKAYDSEDIAIGAGSVITPRQTQEVIDAGAQFIVSPNTNYDVLETCVKNDVPAMPGAYTPTEIQAAWEYGASAVKIFPARALGHKYISDVLAPLPHLKLLPTGGIGLNNLGDYLKAGAIAVGIGSSLVNNEAIADKNWKRITELAQDYTHAVQEASS